MKTGKGLASLIALIFEKGKVNVIVSEHLSDDSLAWLYSGGCAYVSVTLNKQFLEHTNPTSTLAGR